MLTRHSQVLLTDCDYEKRKKEKQKTTKSYALLVGGNHPYEW